jgi:hypothetical protein
MAKKEARVSIPARRPEKFMDALDRLDDWDTIEAALTTIPESSPYRETALRSLDHLKERVLTNHATVREALERLRRENQTNADAFELAMRQNDSAEAEARRLTEGLRAYMEDHQGIVGAPDCECRLCETARALLSANPPHGDAAAGSSPSGGGGA